MKPQKLLFIEGIIGLVVSLPFVIIHLIARPDDAPITPVQHLAAAAANYFGPWGVVLVRLVEFPNAGLRSFSWPLAIGLTVAGAVVVGGGIWMRHRYAQYLCIACWTAFTVVWFAVGLVQIASGLL